MSVAPQMSLDKMVPLLVTLLCAIGNLVLAQQGNQPVHPVPDKSAVAYAFVDQQNGEVWQVSNKANPNGNTTNNWILLTIKVRP